LWRSKSQRAGARAASSSVHPSRVHLPLFGNHEERIVLSRKLVNCSLAALTGAMMLTFSMAPASAFTLASPSLEQSYASGQVQKVWWRHRHCWVGWHGHMHCGW
jgi:hypothetical protein